MSRNKLFNRNHWVSSLAVLLGLLLSLGLISARARADGPTVQSGWNESATMQAAVRYKSFANTGSKEIYLGVPDLGAAENRHEADFTWVRGENNVSFAYIPDAHKLTTTVSNPEKTVTVDYELSLGDLNILQINLTNRDEKASIAFNSVELNGNSLGNFQSRGTQDWTVTGYNLSGGFTLTGVVVLDGRFSKDDKSKLEIKVGYKTPPEPEPETDLRLTKTGPEAVTGGETINYTLTVENIESDSATDVVLTDTLPPGVTFVSASTDAGECGQAEGVVTCTLADIPEHATVLVTIVVTAPDVTEPVTLTNTAHVSADDDHHGDNDTAQAVTIVNPRRRVSARLQLDPELAANQLGFEHTLTATLEFDRDDERGFVAAPAGETITFTLGDGSPGTLSAESCTTDDSGQCSVTLQSNTPGLSQITAAWAGDIAVDETLSLPAEATATAQKYWVDVRLLLEPLQAANRVGQPHTITARLEFDAGDGFQAPLSATGLVSLVKNGPGNFSGPPCDPAAGGVCTVTLDSTETGLTTVSASWSGDIEIADGLTAAATAATGEGDELAKRWVNAQLTITPTVAINPVNTNHVLTATLTVDNGDGAGSLPAAGQTIDFTITNADGSPGSLSCVTGAADGSCQITIQSTVPGTSTVTASWSGDITTPEGTVSVSEEAVATKSWFEVRASIGGITPDGCPDQYDPNDSVADIVPLSSLHQMNPGDIRISRLCGPEDMDFWWIHIDSSSIVTVTLSNLQNDYDLAVYTGLDQLDPNPASDANALITVMDSTSVDSAGRMASGRMASGRMASGRMASGRMASGRMASGRMASGRMASGSAQLGTADEVAVATVEGGQNIFIQVLSLEGEFGSDYTLKVQTKATDVGQCQWTPANPVTLSESVYGASSPQTLILTNLGRVEAIYGTARAQALWNSLKALADATTGVVVPLESDGAVAAAYSGWNANYCNIQAANTVTDKIRALIATQYPNVQYVVLAGSQEIIPARQVLEGPITISPEPEYVGASGVDANNPLFWALQGGRIATDDFYVDNNPFQFLGQQLYVPDTPIGRLVETPEDMSAVIANFLSSNGVVQNPTCLITGYEFLADSAAQINSTLQTFGLATNPLISNTWNANDLRNFWPQANPAPKLVSVNGHFEHWRTLPAVGPQLFFSSDLANNQNVVAYSMGCHAGLNVPDGWIPNTNPNIAAGIRNDFPSVFARQGAAAWFANTGYGYGDDEAIADSELLMLYYTQELGSNSAGVPVGQAMLNAKDRFIGSFSTGSMGIYEAKSLMEATLYGLPMHKVSVPLAQPIGLLRPDIAPLAGATRLAYPATNESVLVTEEPAYSVSPGLLAAPQNLVFSLTKVDTPRGSFLKPSAGPGGLDQVQVTPGRPIQPKTTVKLSTSAGQPLGALLLDAKYEELPDFDPVVTNPATDTTRLEALLSANGWFPDIFWGINRFGNTPRLVVVPGQYNTAGRIERRYSEMNFDVTYAGSGNVDFQPPGIWSVESACSDGTVNFAVKVEDASGIARVLVTHQTSTGWHSEDLSLTPHPDNDGSILASGGFPLAPGLEYFVQALDGAGNTNFKVNTGAYYRTCMQPDASNNVGAQSTHLIPIKLEINFGDGWELVPDQTTFGLDIVTVGGVGQVSPNSFCSVVGTSSGQCSIILTSSAPGLSVVTINPSATVVVRFNGQEFPINVPASPTTFVKEWWLGSISLPKQMAADASGQVCFTLTGGNAPGSSANPQCHTFSGGDSHWFVWNGLSSASNYRLEETTTPSGVTPTPPISNITLDSAHRDVVARTVNNRRTEVEPPHDDFQGCSPGYWKQSQHFDSWVTYHIGDSFKTIFNVNYKQTLLQALQQNGGKEKALGRQAVAALLNAANPQVNYFYSQTQIINIVQTAFATKKYEEATELLEEQNTSMCPLN